MGERGAIDQPACPFVSVVVPTWNRAAVLADCVNFLRAQDFSRDRFEIIVVDDGSLDNTQEVSRLFQDGQLPHVRYMRVQHGGLNSARNRGIAASRGDPVCFVDDDVETPSGWLRALVDGALRHPDAGCLGGPVRVRFEAKPPKICEMESWAWEGELDCGPVETTVSHVNGCNMAVRRWALQKVGFFNESLPLYGEELEWESRLESAGIAIMYVPTAWLWHRRTGSDLVLTKMLRRRFRQGAGYAVYTERIGERKSLWHALWPIPFYLFHALRKKCFGAILEVAWKFGLLWGLARLRWSHHRLR